MITRVLADSYRDRIEVVSRQGSVSVSIEESWIDETSDHVEEVCSKEVSAIFRTREHLNHLIDALIEGRDKFFPEGTP